MILSVLGVMTSIMLLMLPLAVICQAFRLNWRQIAMALNAEILIAPDPIPPVRRVPVRLAPHPRQMLAGVAQPAFRAAA